jgi:hypothetical protein
MYFRKVINDIYYRAFTGLDESEPKISVGINGPGINTTIQTTPKKILEIIKYIENTYSGLNYTFNNTNYSYPDFYSKLIF